jgi:hypothetical protein
MFKVTKYPHGTFSWVDCASTDAASGKKFYADLMAWGTEDIPMGDGLFYTMFKCQGEHVAAISPMQPEMQQQGIPSFWTSYISVNDVDAVTKNAKDLGATVMSEPFDVFDSGRMSLINDPTGASVALWQPKNHIGAGLVNAPGALHWNELATRDSTKACEFFGKLLGWQYEKMEGAGTDYQVIRIDGRGNGGIMQMTEEWGDMSPHWMVYFAVADIDKSLEKVKQLGGKVEVPPVEVAGTGRFAVIADPQGAYVSLIQLESPDPWTE